MTYTVTPMTIKTKTNLHVGSESINYDIVDKTVQRDSITHAPIINASSHKGALRHHFQLSDDSDMQTLIDIVFGKEGEDASQGCVKFLDSYLLFLPLRADNKPFYYVTSRSALLGYCDFYANLGYDLSEARGLIDRLTEDNCIFDLEDAHIESVPCKKSNTDDMREILNLLGLDIDVTQVALFSEANFIDAIRHLPVIARNRIKEGKSENLWYEEIVPRESLFYTAMLDYTNYSKRLERKAEIKIKNFYDTLQNNLIQIGANASIGYGLCSYKDLTFPLETKELSDVQ